MKNTVSYGVSSRRAVTLSLVFFLCPLFLFPKVEFSGRVFDIETKKALPGVTIRAGDSVPAVSTDASGAFSFMLEEKTSYDIDFSFIGYRSIHRTLETASESFTDVNIYLIPVSIEMAPVIVKGEKTSSLLGDLKDHEHLLEGRELQMELSQTLAATLKNEAGVGVRSMGAAPSRPVIRGLGGNSVRINEDGMEAVDISASSPDHAVSIDPTTLEQIELVRGPRLLQYSSVAFGAAVNAVRNDIPSVMPHDLSISAGGGFESMNKGLSGNAAAEYGTGDFSLKAGGSVRETSDMSSPEGALKNTAISVLSGTAGGSYISEDFVAGSAFRSFSSSYGIPGGFTGAHPNGVNVEMRRSAVAARTIAHVHGAFVDDISVNLVRTYFRQQEFESDGNVGADFVIRDVAGTADMIQHGTELSDNGLIGLSYRSRALEPGGYVFTPPTNSRQIAAYTFQEKNFEKGALQIGMRYEINKISPLVISSPGMGERNFSLFSGSVSGIFSFFENIYTGFTLSRSNRAPSAEELFSAGPHLAAYSYETGNPSLQHEQGWGGELFAFIREEGFSAALTFFRNDFSYYIAPRNTGDTNWATLLPVFRADGLSALIYGLEARFSADIDSNLAFDMIFSNSIGTNRTESRPLPMMPPAKLSAGLKYTIGNLTVGIRSEAAAAQRRVDIYEQPTSSYIVFSAYGQMLLQAGSNISIISLTAENLLDTVYRNHLSRIKSIMPEAGSSLRCSFKLFF